MRNSQHSCPERAEFYEKAQPWLSARTVADIVALGQAMRIPVSPVNDGATVADCPQYRDRGFFVDAGGDGWAFRAALTACRGRPYCPYGPRLDLANTL